MVKHFLTTIAKILLSMVVIVSMAFLALFALGRSLDIKSPVVLDRAGQLCAKVAAGTGSSDYIFVDIASCSSLDQEIDHFMVPECFSYKFRDHNNDGIKDLKLRQRWFLSTMTSCENPEGTPAGYYLINPAGQIHS